MTDVAKKKKNLQKHIEKLFEKKQQGFDVETDLNKAYDELTRLECMEAMGIQREEDAPITEDEAEEALKRFESQKNREKASLIINFSVPNTKEDIMEFMILAASNIDVKKGVDDDVTKAWISKLDQVYQRAEISMGGHPDFAQIKSIYDRKKKELKNKKIKGFLIGAGCVAGWFFLIGLLWNPAATIAISIGVLVLVIIGAILFKKR